MSGIKRHKWSVLVVHTIRQCLHRYECQNCGFVWETVGHYGWNFCPGCGYTAFVREEYDDEW